MIIREAAEKDIDQLVLLMEQLGYKTTPEKLRENLKGYKQSVWVLEMDGQAVGCVAYHILDQFHSSEKHMRIVSLVSDQNYRRQGIGKKLLAFTEKVAKDNGCTVIELTSASHRMKNGVLDFYCNQGFRCDGEKIYFRKII